MKGKYGIGWHEYDTMLVSQSGRCGCCSRDFPNNIREPAIDHCHITGAVRGLLCQRCNRAIGLFGDDPTTLTAAALYLQLGVVV